MTATATVEIGTVDIEQEIETLNRICDWRDDLRARLWRAEIQAELIGLDQDQQDQLVAEVAAFKRVCKSLAFLRRAAA